MERIDGLYRATHQTLKPVRQIHGGNGKTAQIQ
jgi:hypothetical protein